MERWYVSSLIIGKGVKQYLSGKGVLAYLQGLDKIWGTNIYTFFSINVCLERGLNRGWIPGPY